MNDNVKEQNKNINNDYHKYNTYNGNNNANDRRKQKINNNNNTTINNYYYADKSPNELEKAFENEQGKPMSNGAIRTILKEYADTNSKITIVGYAIKMRDNYIEKDNEGQEHEYIMITTVNILYQKEFRADHLQLKVPIELYNNSLIGNIIIAHGEVYNYKDYRFEKIEKQSILVDKIRPMIIKDINILNNALNDLKLNYNITNDKEVREIVLNDLIKGGDERTFNILSDTINLLESILRSSNIPDNFVIKYILNQYVINRNPREVNCSYKELLQCKRQSAYHCMLIILSLIKKIKDEEITNLTEIFKYINKCLNTLHGLNKKLSPFTCSTRKELECQLKKTK